MIVLRPRDKISKNDLDNPTALILHEKTEEVNHPVIGARTPT